MQFLPTIGIGAGPATDGQIMVVHDLLGITCLEKPPKFIKNFFEGGETIQKCFEKLCKRRKKHSLSFTRTLF